MTVYVSSDRGKSWPVKRVVYPGPSAYSDLEITNDGNIICLHEAGLNHPYEGIAVTAIPKDKLLSL